MINISEKISSLRKAHNLTQEALGEAVGVSAQAVSKWEKGDSLPDISVIPDICKVFGISADTLLGNEGNMTSKLYFDKALEVCKPGDRTRMIQKLMELEDGIKNFASLLHKDNTFSVADSRGFGMFFNDIEYMKNIMSVDLANSKLFKFISDEKTMKIFTLIVTNGKLTESEMIKITGFSEQEVTERLFELMKCGTIRFFANDPKGDVYALEHNGMFLVGIMANAFLFDPAGRKKIEKSMHYNED